MRPTRGGVSSVRGRNGTKQPWHFSANGLTEALKDDAFDQVIEAEARAKPTTMVVCASGKGFGSTRPNAPIRTPRRRDVGLPSSAADRKTTGSGRRVLMISSASSPGGKPSFAARFASPSRLRSSFPTISTAAGQGTPRQQGYTDACGDAPFKMSNKTRFSRVTTSANSTLY